jgi:hypothetical protein
MRHHISLLVIAFACNFFLVSKPLHAQTRFAWHSVNQLTYKLPAQHEWLDDTAQHQIEGYPANDRTKIQDRFNSRRDPNYTRLLFSNNSRLLQQGEGYYLNQMLFINGAAYGITDYLNVHAGVLLAPKQITNNWYASIRGGTKIGDFLYATAGFTYIRFENSGYVYFPYISASVGTPKLLVTGSFIPGSGIPNYNFSTVAQAFTVGANVQVTKFLAVVTDNWFYNIANRSNVRFNVLKTPSVALRFFGSNFSFDTGLIGLLSGSDTRSASPWLTYTYHFSFRRDRQPD